jgi:hypothetical protein
MWRRTGEGGLTIADVVHVGDQVLVRYTEAGATSVASENRGQAAAARRGAGCQVTTGFQGSGFQGSELLEPRNLEPWNLEPF